jgi:hypothetical protein
MFAMVIEMFGRENVMILKSQVLWSLSSLGMGMLQQAVIAL